MRFEAGMKRDLSSIVPQEETAPHQEDTLKVFAADRTKVWSEEGQSIDRGREAENEKKSTEREQEGASERIEKYQQRIEALRAEISEKKGSLINRLLEFRRINDLEKNLGILGKIKSSAEEDKQRLDELVAGYDSIISQDSELASVKAQAKNEMQQRDQERLAALEQEEKARSVEDIAIRHKCFLVHDIIDAKWKPSANNQALDTKQLSFEDQLDIVLGFEPTLATSSLREGNPEDRTFGKGAWGVFLSGGRVLGGEQGDAGSQAHGLRDRRMHSEHSQSVEVIDEAITGEYKQGYNELVIERPEVAGVYIKWTDVMPPLAETTSVQNGNGKMYDRWWERLKAVASKNLPIFVLTPENQVYMISDIDVQGRTFRVAKAEMQPEDMMNLPGVYQQHLGETEKRTIAMRQIDKVRHLLPSEEAAGIENGPKLTDTDIRENPYTLH